MQELIERFIAVVFYGRLIEPKDRRLKINNNFRKIIGDCIDTTFDIEDLTEDVYRRKRRMLSMQEARDR